MGDICLELQVDCESPNSCAEGVLDTDHDFQDTCSVSPSFPRTELTRASYSGSNGVEWLPLCSRGGISTCGS